jgi:hypothetical protein
MIMDVVSCNIKLLFSDIKNGNIMLLTPEMIGKSK